MDKHGKYLRAKKRVENLKSFYRHLVIYIAVNTCIFAINVYDFEGNWWFFYPLLGWGIGVAAHGFSVWSDGRRASNWEARKIQEYMEKEDDEND